MSQSCLDDLIELLSAKLPGHVNRKRTVVEQVLVARLHFYDTHAPECFFAIGLITTNTAQRIVADGKAHCYHDLWATCQSCADEWIYFPDEQGDGFEVNPILHSCYDHLCDDENPDSFKQYADAICTAAREINKMAVQTFQNVHPCFQLVPADAGFELGDDSIMRLTMQETSIAQLAQSGFLDLNDKHFGIYPPELYGSR